MGRKIVLFGCLLVIIWVSVPIGTGWWVKQELEKRMKVEIEGKYSPVFFQPAFTLQNIRLLWAHQVRINSGDVRIEYHFPSLFSGDLLRVKIEGSHLSGELLNEWARAEDLQDIVINHFYADLGIGPQGIQEVFHFEVDSPILDFRLREASPERPRTRSTVGKT